MNAPRWQAHALYIVDAIAKIRRIQARGDIIEDDILYDAVLRNLQTLSEATQHLPEAFKLEQAHIPWRDIKGFRNILVHNYMGDIDPMTVADVIERYLPALEDSVRLLLASSR